MKYDTSPVSRTIVASRGHKASSCFNFFSAERISQMDRTMINTGKSSEFTWITCHLYGNLVPYICLYPFLRLCKEFSFRSLAEKYNQIVLISYMGNLNFFKNTNFNLTPLESSNSYLYKPDSVSVVQRERERGKFM